MTEGEVCEGVQEELAAFLFLSSSSVLSSLRSRTNLLSSSSRVLSWSPP